MSSNPGNPVRETSISTTHNPPVIIMSPPPPPSASLPAPRVPSSSFLEMRGKPMAPTTSIGGDDTPTISHDSGLSTPPTSPPIPRGGRLHPGGAPPAVEGHDTTLAPRTRSATFDPRQQPVLQLQQPAMALASSSSASVDRAVRALMAELDASIFRNVSSAVSAFFLDINDVGHFVSMPHLGACASPEANHVMRLIEETLTKHASYLLDPTDRHGLEMFGDALAKRVSSDPRVLTPLAKVLIVLRLGHTATAARQGNHPAVAAMVPEFPLYMDAQVQIQARKVGNTTFASSSLAVSHTKTTEAISAGAGAGIMASSLGFIPENTTSHHGSATPAGGLHRSTSLHSTASHSAQVHFVSPPASPSATQLAFEASAASRPSTAPRFLPEPPMRSTTGAATRKRTMSMPTSPSSSSLAVAVAATRPKTEVAVVLESMVAVDARTGGAGPLMRHPVYLLHVQDAAAAAAANPVRFGAGSGGSPTVAGAFMP